MKSFLNNLKRLFICMLISCIALLQANTGIQAASIRGADVETASNGNTLVGVEGNFEKINQNEVLKRINAIRKEACQKGYRNPETGEKLKKSDYTAIKWLSDLEWIAQLRAAEATVNEDHTRPNGQSCFSIQHNGQQSWAENLAWNGSGIMAGIEQWYGEKDDWVNQNAQAVTGHYTSLISPGHTSIGLGSFRQTSGQWYAVSAEFSSDSKADGKKLNLSGKKIQAIEVSAKAVGKAKIKVPSTLKAGQKKNLKVTMNITYSGIMGGNNVSTGRLLDDITWKSSDPSVLSISGSGKAEAKKAGKVTITAKAAGKKEMKATVIVQ